MSSILSRVKDRHAEDWEELARREPYFAVLTREDFLGAEKNAAATAAFFDIGETDVASLVAEISSCLGRELSLTSSLDFGCGVGRLTIPLARRAARVVACDVAPTMLAHARQNAERAGLQNITYIESRELAQLPRGTVDFVCSLLVLQHIPPKVGYAIIRMLLDLLAPGGVAALDVTFARSGGPIRRLARAIRARSQLVHRAVSMLRRDPHRLPYMQMNEYDEGVIDREIVAAGARLAGRFPRRDGDATAALLIIEKRAAKNFI